MRHLGQFAELAEPAHLVGRVAIEQAIDQLAGANRADGRVQAPLFAVVLADGALVELERLAQGAHLGMGEGQGDAGLEHGGVAGIAARQFSPGHQSQTRLLLCRRGPAETEQGLVGVQAVQTHALEQAARILGPLVLQRGHTQSEVGAVAQAALFFVGGRCAADLVEYGGAPGACAALDQGHAEIEAREGAGDLGLRGHRSQHRGGAGEVATGHQQLGLQQTALFDQSRWKSALDARQCRLGLAVEAALVANLGQVEPGPVAHRRRRAFLDQRGEDLTGLVVHAVRQQQAAAQHFGFVAMRRQAVEMLRSHQPGDGAEVLVLEKVEQGVAVVQGLDLLRLDRGRHALGERHIDGCVDLGGRVDRHSQRQRAGDQQRDGRSKRAPRIRLCRSAGAAPSKGSGAAAAGVVHYCQTLTSNSGCSLPVESLMRSST